MCAIAAAAVTARAESLLEEVTNLPCDRGLDLLNSQVQAGSAEALSVAGLFFDRGICVGEDAKRAALLYQRSSDKGSHSGAAGLAFLFATGRGVEQDYGSAGALLRPAGSTKDDGVSGAEFTRGYAFAIALQASRELAARSHTEGFTYTNLIPRRLIVRFDAADPAKSISLPDYHDTALSAQAVAQRAIIREIVAHALAMARQHLPVFDAARYPVGTFQFRMVRLEGRLGDSFVADVDKFESVSP